MATDMCITHVFSSLCPLNLHFVLRVLANLGIKMCFLHLHTEVPPGGSVVKNLPANAGNTCLIPGSEISPGELMEAHSSILAWEIPQRSLVGYSQTQQWLNKKI